MMIQQRKPAQRLFTGLVGRPVSDDTPAPAEVPTTTQTAPKKRGPKPKFGVPMTSKQRAARSYARKKEKKADAERRAIVAHLVWERYRWMMADPIILKGGSKVAYTDRIAHKHGWLRRVHDELLQCSLDDLRKLQKTLEETPDSHGRNSDESSGEGERKYGMSGIERIIAVRDGGERLGTPPEERTSEEIEKKKAPPTRFTPDYLKFLEDEHETFTHMIEKYARPYGCCLLCHKDIYDESQPGPPVGTEYPMIFNDPSDMRFHFEQEYERGMKLNEHYRTLVEAGAPETMVIEAKAAYLKCLHYHRFHVERKELKIRNKRGPRGKFAESFLKHPNQV